MAGRADREGWRVWLGDAVLAAVVGVIVIVAAVYGDDAGFLDYALLAAGSLALAAHRSAPRVVLAVTTASLLGEVLHAGADSVAAIPVVAAVHTAARAGHRGVAAAAAGTFLAGFAVAGSAAEDVAQRTVLLAGWFLCALVTGLADKNWQAYLRQTEQRALEAERTREEAALRRAGEERLRIARELHDSLTHSISIVKLQAGVAVHLARKRGEEIPPALLAIQEASGEAMRELRSTLDVLRTDEPTGSLALLVERARAAGLDVELTVRGRERSLAGGLERAAYRIVQEGLTNAARHAGGAARVSVELNYGERELSVRVTDDGAAEAGLPPAEGTGLTGMRERVVALGGTLRAGPRAEGGFTVWAELPLGVGGMASGVVGAGAGAAAAARRATEAVRAAGSEGNGRSGAADGSGEAGVAGSSGVSEGFDGSGVSDGSDGSGVSESPGVPVGWGGSADPGTSGGTVGDLGVSAASGESVGSGGSRAPGVSDRLGASSGARAPGVLDGAGTPSGSRAPGVSGGPGASSGSRAPRCSDDAGASPGSKAKVVADARRRGEWV